MNAVYCIQNTMSSWIARRQNRRAGATRSDTVYLSGIPIPPLFLSQRRYQMRTVRWGVLSTAKIGTQKVLPAIQRGQYCEVVPIASRDLARAKEEAAQLGIPKAYGSSEELLSDPPIDA